MTIPELWRLTTSRPYRRAALWAGVAVLLAYGYALANFSLVGDEWVNVFGDSTREPRLAVGLGRWAQAILVLVADELTFAPFISLAIALPLLVGAGVFASAIWGFGRPLAVFAAAALFATNPTLSEPLAFYQHRIHYPLATLLAVAAAWLVVRSPARRWLRVAGASLMLMGSLAFYQPIGLAFLVVVLGYEVVRLVQDERYWAPATRDRLIDVAAASIAGVILYFVSVEVSLLITGISKEADPRYYLGGGYVSTPREVVDAVSLGGRTIGRFWLRSTTWYPLTLKVLSLMLALGGLVAAMRLAWGRSRRRSAWLLTLAALTMVAPFLTIFVRTNPSTRYRVFAVIGLALGFWAASLLEWGLGFRRGMGRVAGVVAVGVTILAVTAGAFQVSGANLTLHLNNQRDLAAANRILAVIEGLPDRPEGRVIRVDLAGRLQFGATTFPFPGVRTGETEDSVINCNVLRCQPKHLAQLLNLIGGGHWRYENAYVVDRPEYQEAIAAMPAWPDPGSIQVINGVVIIKGGR